MTGAQRGPQESCCWWDPEGTLVLLGSLASLDFQVLELKDWTSHPHTDMHDRTSHPDTEMHDWTSHPVTEMHDSQMGLEILDHVIRTVRRMYGHG